jgi:hypothetical protein
MCMMISGKDSVLKVCLKTIGIRLLERYYK